jgi:hypothetical protein
MRARKTCRFPDCKITRLQRFGLCNRHRKWVEKGYYDLSLNKLKEQKKVRSYLGMVCKIPDCGVVPRRNGLCETHSSQIKRGTIDFDGRPKIKNGKVFGRYPDGSQCKVCRVEARKITKGFCPKHYTQHLKGHRDLDGMLRIKICRMQSCKRRLVNKARDFCHRHYPGFLKGVYNKYGKRMIPEIIRNKGLTDRKSVV